MSREDFIAESAKQRSLRVALDHYQRPNPLARIKLWLTLAASVIAIAYSAWLAMPTPAARQQLSPGPLAAVHATWNNDCAACHQDFQPLRSDAMSLVGLFRDKGNPRQALDQGCLKCHNTPVHHSTAKAEDVPTCAACHHDHKGLTADIVRPRDSNCLGCHGEMSSHRSGSSGLTPEIASITGFGKNSGDGIGPHPGFRSLRNDPGNVKFNHWLHLQPGIAVADAKKKLRLSDIDVRYQKQYSGYGKTDGLVELDCAACHEADSNGSSMLPIAFEKHCRACHSLSLKVAEDQPAALVPHGLSSDRLTAVLDGLLFASEKQAAERQQSATPRATADESGASPLVPGRTLGNNLAQKISRDVLGRRNTAARAVSIQCLECHVAASSTDDLTIGLPTLLPPNVPATWFRHAKFDHRAHRHVECRSCHAAAFAFEQRDKPQFIKPAANGLAASDNEQVMIAGLASCVTCHAPARNNTGGARFDCAECHKYHGGDSHVGQASSPPSSPSFPGSSLGTHHPEAPASSANLVTKTPAIRLASFQSAPRSPTPFTGTSYCVSSGCHGNSQSNSPAWQTVFTAWSTRDPHAQAFEVLWTTRGREMTRLLSSQTENLTDAEHFQAIEQRCIGCHATPPPPDAPSKAAHYALGVQCESCHGPAGSWLHSHDQANFHRDTLGFIDTKDLNQRASTCSKCHIGPSDATGSPQAVNHDLIAAGHPRLAFEFHAYVQALPAHWDRAKDEARLPLSFHFESWRSGQKSRSDWEQAHLDGMSVDFAQYECSACHHGLTANSWRLQGGLQFLPVKASLPIPDLSRFSMSQRLALARELLTASVEQKSWDVANEAYLAASAITADQPFNKMPDWDSVLEKLGNYLARDCFPSRIRDRRAPMLYDSPSEYDPYVWRKLYEPAVQVLRQFDADRTK
jgi:hypothetical protein